MRGNSAGTPSVVGSARSKLSGPNSDFGSDQYFLSDVRVGFGWSPCRVESDRLLDRCQISKDLRYTEVLDRFLQPNPLLSLPSSKNSKTAWTWIGCVYTVAKTAFCLVIQSSAEKSRHFGFKWRRCGSGFGTGKFGFGSDTSSVSDVLVGSGSDQSFRWCRIG